MMFPPLCQKSGTPSLLASVSSVGFGQRLPGRSPASSADGTATDESIAANRQGSSQGAKRGRSIAKAYHILGLVRAWNSLLPASCSASKAKTKDISLCAQRDSTLTRLVLTWGSAPACCKVNYKP